MVKHSSQQVGEVTVTELSPAVTTTSEAMGLDGSMDGRSPGCRTSHPRHCWHLDQTVAPAVGPSSTLQDTGQQPRLFPLDTDRNAPSSQEVTTKTDPHCPCPLEGILAPVRTTGLKIMPSEGSQTEEDTYRTLSLTCGI